VDGATAVLSFVSSPWMRRYPQSGFSFARRTTRRATLGTVGGRPGLRLLLVSYLLFDEIIVATLPRHLSRWLRADLPHRAERRFGLPVTTIITRRWP